jgi:cytochrome oxidase Cu insertion factor (SCO1/SenC/PrrC family)
MSLEGTPYGRFSRRSALWAAVLACLVVALHAPLQAKGLRVNPHFPGLVDGTGQAVQPAQAARFRLVAFGFSHCADICPPTLEGMRLALQGLGQGSQRLLPVFITIDPDRDPPRALATYVARFDPRILALGGLPAAIHRTTDAYRIQAGLEGDRWVHTSRLTLTAPDGRVVGLVSAEQSPQQIANTVVRLLAADAQWVAGLPVAELRVR